MDIVVPVPKGTRGKDLSVVIQKKKFSVGLKGQDKILDGELCKEIKVDDSTWTLRMHCSLSTSLSNLMSQSYSLEDNEIVLVHLEKLNQQQWWENVLTHHPKIDTTKIEPENSKLSELDGETRFFLIIDSNMPISSNISLCRRGMVEKMMASAFQLKTIPACTNRAENSLTTSKRYATCNDAPSLGLLITMP